MGNLQDELKKEQNRASRFVTGHYKFTGSRAKILEQLKWETKTER